MTDKQKRITEIDSKILKAEKFITKFKKNIPFAVIGGIIFSFVYPKIPRRHGRKPMIATWEYSDAVVFMFVIYFAIYLIPYFYLIDKNKKKIESLKRTKFSIENKTGAYKSTKKFESK